jgi:hypothetical protein
MVKKQDLHTQILLDRIRDRPDSADRVEAIAELAALFRGRFDQRLRAANLVSSPFSEALAQIGPDQHGAILVRGTYDSQGQAIGATAIIAVKVGDHFHLGSEFTYDNRAGYSAKWEVAYTW